MRANWRQWFHWLPGWSRFLQIELDAQLHIVPDLNRQLNDTAREVEQSVVDVCRNFQGLADDARQSVTRTSDVLGGEDGGVEAILETSRSALNHLLDRMEKGSQISRGAVEQMRQIDTAMGRVSRVVSEIEKISLANRILALNAKIEAVHVGELGAGFGVVAEQISAQAQRSNELTDEISGIVKTLAEGLNQAAGALSEMAAADMERAQESRTEVHNALAALENKNAAMRGALEANSRQAETVAENVSRAVMALQFQDRINQRIQHVVESLQAMYVALGGPAGSANAAASARANEVRQTMENRYTMASERVAQPPPGDHGMENVELF